MSNPITQAFTLEILMSVSTPSDIDSGTDEASSKAPIAPALSASVIQWEREFNEEEEEDEPEDFLVDSDDSDSDDDPDEEDDAGNYVVDVSDSVLNLTVRVTPEVLRDIKTLQGLDTDERLTLRVIYGTAPNTLIRQFTIGPDVAILLSEGERVSTPDETLEIVVVADVYDAETIF